MKQPRVDVDLVVTDLMMPELDGAALGRGISQSRPDLPVLYMSAGVFDAADGALNGPTPPFLRKPFLPSMLVESVEARLRAGALRHLVPSV